MVKTATKNIIKKTTQIVGYSFGGLIGFILVLSLIFYYNHSFEKSPAWGVNFSTSEARAYGFDPTTLLARILVDLHPANIRLNTNWDEIEMERGQYSFAETDALLSLADKNNTGVILVVGHKQPRWPECHNPTWLASLDAAAQQQALNTFVITTVNHFKAHPAIKAWQVENEPLFNYGLNCPVQTSSELKAEVKLVKQLDSRPIVLTDSGEKSAWLLTAWAGADILGSTMYREVFQGNQNRYIKYNLPAFTYTVKAGMITALSATKSVIGVELQAEPWFNGNPMDIPLDKQFALMNPQIFADNVQYAKQSGFSEHYFWGTEWWYWLNDFQHNSSMLDAAKNVFVK